MDSKELETALGELNQLAEKEYHASLAEVANEPDDSEDTRLLRIGRLLGVTLKIPFADPEDVTTPSRKTRAYRVWNLKPVEAFEVPDAQTSWQYKALHQLSTDPDVVNSLGGKPGGVFGLVQIAQNERGFWWFLATSCRRYLCRDHELRTQIEEQVEQARRAGIDLRNVTPEILVATGGLTVGNMLVASIPALGTMGAPVIAGLIFIIYSIGLDAFCRWSEEHKFFHPDFPNADEEIRET